MQTGGVELKIDDGIKSIVRSMRGEFDFEIFVSLSCHNCPDVVQALNQFALLNPNISVETIDGGLFQSLIRNRDIQGVPCVFLNGKLFANGKINTASILEKLQTENKSSKSEKQKQKLELQDVTIIGGGPAGISASIYAARKGLKVTLITEEVGGQVRETMGIENLISVSSTTGPELNSAMQSHMLDYKINTKFDIRVTHISNGNIKSITLSSGEIIDSRTIIIATGAKWRELGIPGEREFMGNGVAFCPHCDGPFFKGKDIAVIGGGNSGVEASLDLSGIARSVSIFEYMPDLKADQVLIDQLKLRKNISIYTNVKSERILSNNGKVSAIEYTDRGSSKVFEKELAGIFVQIGLIPNSQFLKGIVDLNSFGEVIIDASCQTSVEGIFACGDVTTVPYKQIIISMGEGAKASLAASDYLLKQ